MSETRVVNLRYERYDVYIGRGSKWGNPYTHLLLDGTKAEFKVDTREEAIEGYKDWIRHQQVLGNLNLDDFLELKGKRLGCYCAPKSCHGDILVEIVDAIEKEYNANN